ncbi:hypothetical protein BB560_001720 [Smittium megazygosporum]|uniref:[RNA-polymerase]-subunit kinase n=1 Tax=Smittium megazygosporum TaxID=133381 RepID=A0A2T9ZGS4_9FUNG|nr:hypothetical protein BB560_001720 [Smittium megazygosporum]
MDVFTNKQNLNLVIEYLETDLELLIKDKNLVFISADIKSWMFMMLKGLDHCHQSWIIHRDMKPNNLLVAADGTLRIADFGLARDYGDASLPMTSQTVTRWYRAPELIFGAKYYSAAIDMWAVGCIFAELMLRTPYLPGDTDIDQLQIIVKALGTPTEEDWPGLTKLPNYIELKPYPKVVFSDLFTAADANALDLLSKLLTFDPSKRITSRQALLHPYFSSLPRPTLPENLPKISKPIIETTQQVEERKLHIAKAFVNGSLNASPSHVDSQ